MQLFWIYTKHIMNTFKKVWKNINEMLKIYVELNHFIIDKRTVRILL